MAEAKSCSAELVKSLLTCGAHLDEVNAANQSFESLLKEPLPLRILIDPMPYLSLKCLAARVVSQNQLQGCVPVPVELQNFIDRH